MLEPFEFFFTEKSLKMYRIFLKSSVSEQFGNSSRTKFFRVVSNEKRYRAQRNCTKEKRLYNGAAYIGVRLYPYDWFDSMALVEYIIANSLFPDRHQYTTNNDREHREYLRYSSNLRQGPAL